MAIEYKVNLEQEGRIYPHYWELCIGSCHAATVLREDVREQIRAAHRDCGFRYLRFHGLFDDDMSVAFRNMMMEEEISFFNVDSIFDFLLDVSMKPFVEIGFMPEMFASGTKTCFHYKGNITLPADFDVWVDFIRQFGKHLLERYGKEEVGTWFFEVWNEPNLNFFFDGTQEDYFHLYQVTAEALKSVDECFRVGGPATSVNAWIPEFRAFCENNNVPLDFITTHHYPNDDPLSAFGTNEKMQPQEIDEETLAAFMAMTEEERNRVIQEAMQTMVNNENPRDILRQMTVTAKEQAGDYPLYYTEWNGSEEYDTSYQAAFVIQTLAYNEGLVEGYSYWTVSDIFEELGMKGWPYKNAFGIQTIHGIPKPVYRAFQILHEAGDRRLDVEGSHRTAEVLALKGDKGVSIIVYNHDLHRREIKSEEIQLTISGSVKKIKKAVIDEKHCNPRKVWEQQGSPKYLSKRQIDILRKESELVYEDFLVESQEQVINFIAEPESITVFICE